jgi:hypothetical protein
MRVHASGRTGDDLLRRSRAVSYRCLWLLAVVLVGGCGSSSPTGSSTPTLMSHVSMRTPAGVRYSAEITVHGARECSTQTYSVLAEHRRPFTHSTVACGVSGHAGGPILIQVARPATRLILDRPTGGCGPVHIVISGGRQIAVVGSCSATRPVLRVTDLPLARSLTITGIGGLTRLSMRDHPCSFICIQELSTSK